MVAEIFGKEKSEKSSKHLYRPKRTVAARGYVARGSRAPAQGEPTETNVRHAESEPRGATNHRGRDKGAVCARGVAPNYTKCLVLLRAAKNRPRKGNAKIGGMAEPPRRDADPTKQVNFVARRRWASPTPTSH